MNQGTNIHSLNGYIFALDPRPICNRAGDGGDFQMPADDWYQLVPFGDYPHPESGMLQVIDERAAQSIVNRFKADAAKPNFAGLLIDQEHWSYDPEKSSEAYGWIKELENRADGVWGKVKWTDVGEAAVKSGRYRLRSPTWLPSDVEQLENKRIRPLRLDSVGLTNNPNLRGMVPLSNRSGDLPEFRRDARASSADKDRNTNPHQSMKSLCTALGLSADASEEAAIAELTKIKNRVTTAEEALEPLNNRITALTTEVGTLKSDKTKLEADNTKLLGDIVEQDLAKYGNRFKPEAKDAWKAQLIANRAGTIALLESLPEPQKGSQGSNGKGTNGPMHNRASTQNPNGVENSNGAEAFVTEFRSQVSVLKNRTAAMTAAIQAKPTEYQAWREANGQPAL